MSRRSLWDSFLLHMNRLGHWIPERMLDRDPALPVEPSQAVQDVLVEVYQSDPASAQVCERMVDIVAKELGLDPLEVRRRNIPFQRENPSVMVTGRSLSSATARESLEDMAELVELLIFGHQMALARKLEPFGNHDDGEDPAAGVALLEHLGDLFDGGRALRYEDAVRAARH